MTPLQLAALEQFLANNGFVYDDYDEEAGVVIYSVSRGDWRMEVAYGDECYYCVYNDVTEEAGCAEITNLSELMLHYDRLGKTQRYAA
jgi:hypothetical protein